MKVPKIAAIIAVVGIGASFLLMRVPTVNTVRVASGASWDGLQRPTKSRLEKAVARNPSDWKLRLIHARHLYRDGSWQASPKAEQLRIREFERLVRGSPEVVVVRAAYVRWLLGRDWHFVDLPVGGWVGGG